MGVFAVSTSDDIFKDYHDKNAVEEYPLHIPLDHRTKTTGVILTEHMKCLDVISRSIQFVEKLPEDLLNKTLAYIKGFF